MKEEEEYEGRGGNEEGREGNEEEREGRWRRHRRTNTIDLVRLALC